VGAGGVGATVFVVDLVERVLLVGVAACWAEASELVRKRVAKAATVVVTRGCAIRKRELEGTTASGTFRLLDSKVLVATEDHLKLNLIFLQPASTS
jgi:hypothetical protein